MSIKSATFMVVLLLLVVVVPDDSPHRSEVRPDQPSQVVASGMGTAVVPTGDAVPVFFDSLPKDLRHELRGRQHDEPREFPVSDQPDFVAEPEDPTKVHFIAEPEDPDLVCFEQVAAGQVRFCDLIGELRPVAVGSEPSP